MEYQRGQDVSLDQPEPPLDDRYIVWFDIDDTLYPSSSGVAEAMIERIQAYFEALGARDLYVEYYAIYGLSLRGLLLHHNVDPLDFDRECDASLPLKDLLKPNPSVRKLLEDIDRKKARVWALTNAYRTHAERVLRILNLDDLIEGLVYCDYAEPNFSCKPERAFYKRALRQANVADPSKCFFVDDSRQNAEAALDLGWGRCVHYAERLLDNEGCGQLKVIDGVHESSEHGGVVEVITDLEQLRVVWSDVFKSSL